MPDGDNWTQKSGLPGGNTCDALTAVRDVSFSVEQGDFLTLLDSLRVELRALIKSLGATAILVTHDPAEAMSMSDQVVVMKDGQIVQRGTPRDVFLRPTTVLGAQRRPCSRPSRSASSASVMSFCASTAARMLAACASIRCER